MRTRPDHHSSPGYTGPVAHWWQNCLQFTGVGLDWRYEGILHGYLNLYRATRDRRWLDKAKRAGDDLHQGQQANGSYRHSSFEANPYPDGTPHEAAADAGLLALTAVLKAEGDPTWQTYQETAERNLRGHFIARLWDAQAGGFRDVEDVPSLVPNKAATLCEALFQLAALTGDSSLIEGYALPTLDALLTHQVREGALAGAIYQNSQYNTVVPRFFPYYIARCIPALLLAHAHSGQDKYAQAALDAMRFVFRWRDADGAFVQLVYPGERCNRYPRWAAPIGDILRAAELLQPLGFDADLDASCCWMLSAQNANGGIGTARGFGAQISQRRRGALPEFRDLLPVCGWADKAFRYLTGKLPNGVTLPHVDSPPGVEADCTLRGQRVRYIEDDDQIALKEGTKTMYRWQKGDDWAIVCAPNLLWK
jgi:hypothetical protein